MARAWNSKDGRSYGEEWQRKAVRGKCKAWIGKGIAANCAAKALFSHSWQRKRRETICYGIQKTKRKTIIERRKQKKMENIKVKLTFLVGPLGTAPNDEDLYRNFIGSKAPDAETLEEEVKALGVDAVAEKGMTVFARDEKGNPIFWDYQIKGFFKDTCGMLSRVGGKGEDGKKRKVNESSKLTAFKKIIDGLIFVSPRKIPITMGGEMGVCQRSLRAQTMQGDRVTLAMSEECPNNSTITFTVYCLSPEHTAAVREWLNYGFLRGLGQWRNSGRGKFVWEELDENGQVIGGNAALSDMERLALVS